MVNTGKPSRGCYMCRARRIKCDEAKPHCMRCQKSKRVCPGYRDAFELKLRDESKSTKKKLNRRTSQSQDSTGQAQPFDESFDSNLPFAGGAYHSSHSRNSSITSNASFTSNDEASTAMVSHHNHSLISSHLTTPIQQQAACYFLSNFVLVPEEGTMRGYLDFVIPLLKQKTPTPALLLAFSAVTMAALGTRPNSKALLPKADFWYVKALKEINSTLKDPKTASTDSALASVMLMASFEQLTPSRMKVGGWSSHIDGAVAVMKSRGPQSFQSKVAKELFIAVRAHMTLHCIANSKPVDLGFDWLGVEADDKIVQSFATVNLKMAALRADNDATTALKLHTAENIEKVLGLLRRAEALDKQYLEWIKNLPANWAIKTVAWIDGQVPDLENSVVHPGRVDAYGELWMAYKYNIVRGCRLFIWTTILRCVAWLGQPRDYKLTPEYTTASRICRQLVEDIVASVPYFFGWNRDKDVAMADRSNFACGTNDHSTVKPLAGIFVMWPMFAAATSDFASPSQRIFLRGRLKYVAEMMGINQALILFQVQMVHPSLYIARERMHLTPTTCHSSDTQVKIIAGVPSASVTVPEAGINQCQWGPSPTTKEQLWKQAPQSAIPKPLPSQMWSMPLTGAATNTWSTVPVPQQAREKSWSPPRTEESGHSLQVVQSWSVPPSAGSVQPEQSMQTWITSPTSQPTNAWASPPTGHAGKPWNGSPNTQALSTYSSPPNQTWSTAPTSASLQSQDQSWASDQVWSASPEDSDPNWIPRSFMDEGFLEQNGVNVPQGFEANREGYGVAFSTA